MKIYIAFIICLVGCKGVDRKLSDKTTSQNDSEIIKVDEHQSEKYLRDHWNNYIKFALKYSSTKQGDIRDIQMVLLNTTGFILDKAEVTISIHGLRDDTLRTDTFVFKNVNKTSEVVTPKGDRKGFRISTKFNSMYSKELDFCYPSPKPYNLNDLYHCQ